LHRARRGASTARAQGVRYRTVTIALFAPKGTPQPIRDKLTDVLDRALDDENVRRRLVEIGGTIPAKAKRGKQPLAALVKTEIARWTPIIGAANK
jgi:tripartite-type tricarboxylate transporter receptor subunit TctC